ncbi:aminotran_1_2 domain-containing protein, partial [Haematococcus lacustris]
MSCKLNTPCVWCNIGNPQILGQKPITYFRQVLALCEYPPLLDHPQVAQLFPSDVRERARSLLAAIPGGVGAYSDSAGALILRKMVAAAIERRDGGIPCSTEDLFLTDGASPAVHYLMDLLLRDGGQDGLMVPIPQYPLYSATLTLYGGRLVPYLLDEERGWALDPQHLRLQLQAARAQGTVVRGMVVINPGNPTGQCLSRQNMEDIITFCAAENLVLMADEVYQSNIYSPDRFVGECGRRGGYMEVTGFPPAVKEQLLKLASINLCPNLSGQICCALMMNPPMPGEPSHELYEQEKNDILASLKRRAELLVAGLNKLEGVTCNAAEGALYAFPRITLPARALEAAKKLGKPGDWLYCRELLAATGIVVVPGSGFGQKDDTLHFRTTFLPSEEDIG